MTSTENLIELVKASKWICRRRPFETEVAVLSLLRGFSRPYTQSHLERVAYLHKSEICREKNCEGLLITILFEVMIGVIVSLIVRWIISGGERAKLVFEAAEEQQKRDGSHGQDRRDS